MPSTTRKANASVLELSESTAVVIRCFADPTAIEAMPVPPSAFPCRIAPDELLLLLPREAGERTLADLSDDLAVADPGGIALDQTDGFTLWTVAGDTADKAFARLSAIPLPVTRPCFVQGLVARVPAKTLAFPGELHILVSSTLGHAVHAEILAACADLGVQEVSPRMLAPYSAAGAAP